MTRAQLVALIACLLALVYFWSVMRNRPDRRRLRVLRRNRADLRRALKRN